VGESPNTAKASNCEAEETCLEQRKPGAVPPDKSGLGLESDPAGRRYRTQSKPREDKSVKPSHSSTGEGSTCGGKAWPMAAVSSGGVMAAARREGLYRNW